MEDNGDQVRSVNVVIPKAIEGLGDRIHESTIMWDGTTTIGFAYEKGAGKFHFKDLSSSAFPQGDIVVTRPDLAVAQRRGKQPHLPSLISSISLDKEDPKTESEVRRQAMAHNVALVDRYLSEYLTAGWSLSDLKVRHNEVFDNLPRTALLPQRTEVIDALGIRLKHTAQRSEGPSKKPVR